jgi:hypothetical protein
MIFEQLYLQRGKKSKNLRCFWPLQKSNILLMLNPELLPAGFFIIQAEREIIIFHPILLPILSDLNNNYNVFCGIITKGIHHVSIMK